MSFPPGKKRELGISRRPGKKSPSPRTCWKIGVNSRRKKALCDFPERLGHVWCHPLGGRISMRCSARELAKTAHLPPLGAPRAPLCIRKHEPGFEGYPGASQERRLTHTPVGPASEGRGTAARAPDRFCPVNWLWRRLHSQFAVQVGPARLLAVSHPSGGDIANCQCSR
jgi:hypothetical protein